jgi:hypothetical protein
VLNLNYATAISIGSCIFSNVTTKQGPFLSFSNVASILITDSNFTNGTAASGYGGAVCGGEDVVIV